MFGFPFSGGLNGDDFFPHRDADFEETIDEDSWSDIEFSNQECSHSNMESTVRTDYCPGCGYTFYYRSAH